MKQAYMILCHKNPEQVNKLINVLDNRSVDFFIHIDKKIDHLKEEFIHQDNIYYVKNNISVGWGDYTQIVAMIKLLNEVKLSGKRYDYITLLSGQDLPIKSNKKITEFLQKTRVKNLLVR